MRVSGTGRAQWLTRLMMDGVPKDDPRIRELYRRIREDVG